MHERSFSQNGVVTNSVTTRRKKPSIWSSGDWMNSVQESTGDIEALKMPKRNSDINRKLESILTFNKPDSRSKLNSRARNQSFQQGNKPNNGINVVGTSPFSRKKKAENYISQQVKSANNSLRMASPKDIAIETSTSFFPFKGIKSAMNSTCSSPCNSPLRGTTSGESFFNATRKKIVSIDLAPEMLLAKRDLTHQIRSQSTSKNRSTSETKPNLPKPKLRIRQRKEFKYGDFGLTFFKPLRSNFAIRIPDRQECDNDQQNLDNPMHGDKKNNLQKGFYNQLLLSSLIPTDFMSPAKKTEASIAKLFKTLNSKYSLKDLDAEEVNKEPKSPQNNKLIFNPQVSLRKHGKHGYQKSQITEVKNRNFMSAQNFYPKKDNFISSFLEKNRKCRQIIVLYSELMKQSSLLVATMSIPIYEKVHKHDEAKKDFDKFLKEAEDRLFCPASLRYAFLASGEPISYLNEVPNDCNIILLSHSALYQFQIRYKEYHLMKTISNEKWNLLLFLLNQQTEVQKVKYLITSSKFNKTVVCNNAVDFNQLLNMEFFPTIKENATEQKRYSNQIEKALEALENLYKDRESHILQNKDPMVDEYNKVLNKINQELKQGEYSIAKTKAGILEKMFNQLELFLRHNETNEFYLDCLDIILKESSNQKNGQIQQEYKSSPAESPKNFLIKNIEYVSTGPESVYKAANLQKPLSKLNVPKLQIEKDFTKRELQKLYIRYKAVCIAFKRKAQNKPLSSTQFQASSDPMIDRIFEFGDGPGKNQEMNWQKFIKLMMAVRAKSVQDKMSLFLYLMDTNGNASFSFEEVVAVCKSSLNQFRKKDHNKMIDSLADYFAKTVFQASDLHKEAEILLNKLREIVDTNPEAVDLLLAFAGAKETQDGEFMLESDGIVNRKPNIQLEEYFV